MGDIAGDPLNLFNPPLGSAMPAALAPLAPPLILSGPAHTFADIVRPDLGAPSTPPSALPSAPGVAPGPFAAPFAPPLPGPPSGPPVPSFPALAAQTGQPYRPTTFFGGLHPFALYGAPAGMLGGGGLGGGLFAALMRSNPMLLAALLARVRGGAGGPAGGGFAV